jgi:general secretion pathway protein A
MYAKFFGLEHEPFSIAPDPRYLYMSKRHREALAHLLYGLNGGGGFVLLSGEIGAGKTTVCRCFLEQIPKRCNVAYIFNPKLTVLELLQSVCEEFHIPIAAADTASVKHYIDPLNAFLLKTHAVGQNNVLIIDEAQNLSADVLEQLRLLTNLETNERKLLQIVLIGQPELRTLLARPELEQLAQRIIARFHLKALSESETGQYIGHRLAVAGMTAASPFDARTLRHIHRLSRGVPRRINLLCDRAMLGAYARGKAAIDRAMVDKAAREVFSDLTLPAGARARYGGIALLALGLLLGAALYASVIWATGGGGALRARGVASSSSSPATQLRAAASASSPAAQPRTAASASIPAAQPRAAASASSPATQPRAAANALGLLTATHAAGATPAAAGH